MRKENLTGQKFGRLTVTQEIESNSEKEKRPRWKCLCECGKEIIVARGSQLKKGQTRSCGCLRSEASSERATQRNLDNRKYDPRIATARKVYGGMYKDGNLTFEEFLYMSQQNCSYCGVEPSNIGKNFDKRYSEYFKQNSDFKYTGLDRIDSSKPHDLNNVVPCCKYCNFAKRERSIDEFKNWLKKAYKYTFNK